MFITEGKQNETHQLVEQQRNSNNKANTLAERMDNNNRYEQIYCTIEFPTLNLIQAERFPSYSSFPPIVEHHFFELHCFHVSMDGQARGAN